MLVSIRTAATQLLRMPGARVIALLGAVVLYVLGLLVGADWRFLGVVAWFALSGYVFYRYGIRFFSNFILPIEANRESRKHAYDVLRRYARGYKAYMGVVRDGMLLPAPGEIKERADSGTGAILVDSTSAVVLFTHSGPTRVKGPGLHFTREGERIEIVIDLRPQTRSETITAQTRDGIWVRTKVAVKFQIDGVKPRKVQHIDQKQEPLPEPYHWSQSQLRRALGLESVEKEKELKKEEKRRWDHFILDEAIKHARILIARYTFDGLLEPHNPTRDPHAEIGEALEEHVKSQASGSGVTVIGVGLSQFEPRDRAIDLQRFESWQAEWLRRMTITRAIGKTRSRRTIELARAQAQMDTVSRIIQALEASEQAGANNADLIALRFLETVESLANDTLTRWNLSEESQQTLDQIRQRLLRGNHYQGSNPAPKSG
jgi:hypothetical protein